MRVNYYAMLRQLTGCASESIDLSAPLTVGSLLSVLLEKYPSLRPYLLDASGNLRRDLPIFIDGRNPRLLPAGLDEPLSADNVISLFTPIASGRMNVEGLRLSPAQSEEGPP